MSVREIWNAQHPLVRIVWTTAIAALIVLGMVSWAVR